MVLSVGTVVAGYRIESVLGAGGMGTVYKAAHPSLPRSDALKILGAELSHEPQFRSRFLREADLAAGLDHPNVVTVYNRGETDEGQLWIAMQFVQGSDADKEVREGRMTPQRAVHIIGEVAKALDYTHRGNLVHRDVKPANFLLAPDDERMFLADFGIARALDETVGLTQDGVVLASVAYAAPESLSGEDVDGRADIYSLGCSLFRLLTAKTPFAGSAGGWAGMAAAHLTQPPPRATERVPALPAAIDDVIAKAMAKEPEDRYQSARDFAAAAAAALDETTVKIDQSAIRSVPQTMSTAPTVATGQTLPAAPSPPPVPAPAKPKRRKRLIAVAVAAVVLIAAVLAGVLFIRGSGERPYREQAFVHLHGTTNLTAAPKAVAALGPGDGDAVLSLGVQPVVVTTPGGTLPSWEQTAVSGDVRVLGFIDTAVISAAKPDVIIVTSDIDDATYRKLNAIAPTVTRPDQGSDGAWTWQTQLKWIGRILGRDGKAADLVDTARTQQADLRTEHPGFNGKSVEAVSVSDSGVAEITTPSNLANYLEGLGLRYRQELQRKPGETGTTRPVVNTRQLYLIETDVLVVVRTDRAAGNGGFAGLPKEFGAYHGALIVADDPNMLAAFADPGGYLATQYLNENFVGPLARQVQ